MVSTTLNELYGFKKTDGNYFTSNYFQAERFVYIRPHPIKNPGTVTKIAITEDISDGDVMK